MNRNDGLHLALRWYWLGISREVSFTESSMKITRSFFGSCAAAAVMWFATAGSANAITVRGFVDPDFGGDATGELAGAYWTAEIQFSDADGSCVENDGPNQTCVFDPGSLVVTGTLTEDGGSITAPLNFLFTGPVPTTININVVGGVVTAIDTGQLGPTAQFTTDTLQGFAWIDFGFGNSESIAPSLAELLIQLCPPTETFSSLSEFEDWCHVSPDECSATSPQFTSDLAAVTIAQVPEPGMLWLLLAALPLGALMRRRSQMR
jgi:hypothetical protein